MHKLIIVATTIIAVLMAIVLVACQSDEDKIREADVDFRFDTYARAAALHPDPQIENFPARESLVEFAIRTDLLEHPWYVYILADTGNVIGYYVARQRPVNSCTFLSSTEDIEVKSSVPIVLTAPSLDGIYYGGSGASAGCDAWFFFDAATDAMIEIRGVKFFISDQPLLLEAEPIVVAR